MGPGGLLLVMGGQKAHFGAEKWARRPLEAIPSSGAVERKLRAVHTDSVAKLSDWFGSPGPLEDDCNENTGQKDPKPAILAVLCEFLRHEGSKWAKNFVDRSLYLYN